MNPFESMVAALWGPQKVKPPPSDTFEARWEELPTGAKAKPWPSDDDVAFARKYDATYGDPAAGFLGSKGGVLKQLPAELIPDLANNKKMLDAYAKLGGGKVPVDIENEVYKGYLASKRNAVSALGFDPRHLVVSPKSDVRLTSSGLTWANPDLMWSNLSHPATLAHEAMHRGFNKMENAGALAPQAGGTEEMIVRALMAKNFGDIEASPGADFGNRQIVQGKRYFDDPRLLEAERVAAEQYVRQRPMGPR